YDQVSHYFIFGSQFIYLAYLPYIHFAQPPITHCEQAATMANAGPPSTDRVTSSLTKIRKTRRYAPILVIISSEMLFFSALGIVWLRFFLLVFYGCGGVFVRAPLSFDTQLLGKLWCASSSARPVSFTAVTFGPHVR
ncbi:hypothetical protein, partial [Klebsiella pneumoniae]|uniref:hypothetical protein n=4 Tax=Klebsiella pneumoniae TaxID=573 RepID=UPI001C46ABA6